MKVKNSNFKENKYNGEFIDILFLTKIKEYISINDDIIVVNIIL